MATLDQDGVLKLVGSVYDAAVRPALWGPVLHGLSDALRGAAITLHGQDDRDRIFLWFTTRTDPIYAARFEQGEGYATPAKNPCIAPLREASPAILMLREAVQDDDAFRMSDLYNDIIRPQGFWHWGFSALVKEPKAMVPLGILRPAEAGPFAGDDLRLMNHLLVHLRRAIQIMLRLHPVGAGAAAGEEVLDGLSVGVLLLDTTGRVLRANQAAERIVAAGDGLRVVSGKLSAATTRESARLAALIAAAARTSAGEGLESGGALTAARASSARPLSVLVAPLRVADSGFGPARATVAVFVSDPDMLPRPPTERFAQCFGLGPRQAQLAALLADGHGLAQAADRLAMSRNTARAHLRAIFAKTGTHRQSELVRLLGGAPLDVTRGNDGDA